MPTRVITNAIYDALTREKVENNESNSKPITGVMRLLVCGDFVAVGTNDRPLWSDENWSALIRHLGESTLTEISGNERSCYDFLTKRKVGAGLHQVTPLALKEGRVYDSELGLTLVKATTVTDPNTNEVTELMSSIDMTYNMMTGWIKKISNKHHLNSLRELDHSLPGWMHARMARVISPGRAGDLLPALTLLPFPCFLRVLEYQNLELSQKQVRCLADPEFQDLHALKNFGCHF